MPDPPIETLLEIASELELPTKEDTESHEAFRSRVLGALWETKKSFRDFVDIDPSQNPQAHFMNKFLNSY